MTADDRGLFEAIGRIVIGAAELEYAVALLVAVTEGLRGRDAGARAHAIVKVTGQAGREFQGLATSRPDLAWLQQDTAQLMRARNFIAHPVVQEDAVAEGKAALFIVNSRSGEETMITMAQVVNHVEYFKEARARIYMAIANELRNAEGGS
jgi:hypothetical protein